MDKRELPCENCITLAVCASIMVDPRYEVFPKVATDNSAFKLYRKCSILKEWLTDIDMSSEEGMRVRYIVNQTRLERVSEWFKERRITNQCPAQTA